MEQKIPLTNIPEPSETPVDPPVNSPSKKPFLIVLLVVLLVILSSLGTYFFVKSQTSSPTPVVSPTPTNSAFLIPSTSEGTANWKTYTFKDFPLSFKYPDSVQLKEVTPQKDELETKAGGFKVEIIEGKSSMTIDPDGIEGLGFENNDYEVSGNKLSVNNKIVNFGNNDVYKNKIVYKPTNSIWYFIPIRYPMSAEKSVTISYKNDIDDVDLETQKLFDQILSTFKFH